MAKRIISERLVAMYSNGQGSKTRVERLTSERASSRLAPVFVLLVERPIHIVLSNASQASIYYSTELHTYRIRSYLN
jgi:hypothetical protein